MPVQTSPPAGPSVARSSSASWSNSSSMGTALVIRVLKVASNSCGEGFVPRKVRSAVSVSRIRTGQASAAVTNAAIRESSSTSRSPPTGLRPRPITTTR